MSRHSGLGLDPSILMSMLCTSVALVDRDEKAAEAKLHAGYPHSSSFSERPCLKGIKWGGTECNT